MERQLEQRASAVAAARAARYEQVGTPCIF
jgi:hypothetical protein